MKKTIFLLSALLIMTAGSLHAQKKPLDHSVYDGWQSVSNIKLSPDGRLVSYEINPQEGDGTLYVRNLVDGREISVPRGSGLRWGQDAKYGLFTIKAPFADTRQGRIEKKKRDDMPKDSLARIDFGSLDWQTVGASGAAELGYDATPYLFVAQAVKDRESSDLLVINTASWAVDTLKNISDFKTDRSGTRLLAVTAKEEKDSLSRSGVILYDFTKGSADTLSLDMEDYGGLRFNATGDKLLFTATAQDEDSVGTPAYGIWLAQEKILKKTTRRTPALTRWECSELLPADSKDLPEGWVLGESASPAFSNRSSRVIFSLSEYFPAKDTTVYDFEAAQLDIWVWDKQTVPPMDKARGGVRRSLQALVNLDKPGTMVVLSQNPYDRMTFFDGAEAPYALSVNTGSYVITNYWDADGLADISLVNLADGSRTLIEEGAKGDLATSPYGRHIAWFNTEDGNWYSWNLADGSRVNLTGDTGVAFWDEEDDHPIPGYTPESRPMWVGKDEALVICDRYDVWKFSPDGKKKECLTKGAGRRDCVEYYPAILSTSTDPFLMQNVNNLPSKGSITLNAFDEKTKRNGYATVDIQRGGEPVGFLAENSFTQVRKAEKAGRLVFLKGDFRHPMDLYVSPGSFEDAVKLTSINPQQQDYRWGDVQLVHWNAYDGTPLDGMLFTPDGLDASKKYPMMIYFYEKNSETLFDYRAPAPSRSIINIPFYVSRGYVVFVPDIVYVDGHPGESAYNCICAGAEEMCRRFSFIDRDKMAIQGQSWGGYQTAYLVTRTDMFAAAGAGAPVGNMTSAYGGIRWESGSSRIPQYEHGQSRIGKTLWEEGGLDLYIENSPVFFAPKVKTPVLIMHNDNDGAVPWYQGIEFFMSLRRLGKPAWLLEYNNESHNLVERRNSKDLSIRLQQFFDHYLQGAPEPVWMKEGIPFARKGNYFATEYAE
ncbi:MAG: prolyl oligopeptidase family serine peptidase [Bacteroidales bacterium]|nr:prolyl oligopeptidase family serine peptidase [Bacteroidales bacterium]